jgi:hypothetical protein
VLEVNALKFAYNRSVADCAAVALRAVLSGVYTAAQRAAGTGADVPPARKPLLAQLKKAMARWSALLRRYVSCDDDQAELIASLEVAAAPRAHSRALARRLALRAPSAPEHRFRAPPVCLSIHRCTHLWRRLASPSPAEPERAAELVVGGLPVRGAGALRERRPRRGEHRAVGGRGAARAGWQRHGGAAR